MRYVVAYNLRELFNKYLRWSRSRAKVTAPAPAKYPGSGSETLDTNMQLKKCTVPVPLWLRWILKIPGVGLSRFFSKNKLCFNFYDYF